VVGGRERGASRRETERVRERDISRDREEDRVNFSTFPQPFLGILAKSFTPAGLKVLFRGQLTELIFMTPLVAWEFAVWDLMRSKWIRCDNLSLSLSVTLLSVYLYLSGSLSPPLSLWLLI